MLRRLYRACVDQLAFKLAPATVLIFLVQGQCWGEAATEARQLQLEVYINNAPVKLIGAFTQRADQRMMSRRSELSEMGINVPGTGSRDQMILVDDLPGVTYRYDEPAQRIYFTLGDERRVAQTYDLRGGIDRVAAGRTDLGAVLNYVLFASSTKTLDNGTFGFSGANATLDGRLFGRFGTLSQSAIVGTTTTQSADLLRLDSTWTYSDPSTEMSYRAGDTISGGLAWTRPIRLGGVQMQRNFALRPDLVTLPLPTVSGSAAVPSTVDVYVDNVKTQTQEVPSGPFQITNIPTVTGPGTARIVVHDASGHQTETNLAFYTSPKLLREGLLDFSVEAGLPRLQYGSASDTYVTDPVASASLRGGVYDWLTVEGHAEGDSNFLNGGLGAAARVASWGVLSGAASASSLRGTTGYQGYLAYDTQVGSVAIHASSQRTLATYNDLASATADALPLSAIAATGIPSLAASVALLQTSALPPKALDTISLGFPLPETRSWINLSFLHQIYSGGENAITSISYSRPVLERGSAYVTAFSDLRDRKNSGVLVGLTVPVGDVPLAAGATSASTSVASTRSGTNVTVEAARSLQPDPGSYGWDVRDSEGGVPSRSASASYRSSAAQFDGYVQQVATNAGASVQAQGAIVAMGGGVFLSNHIDDAFAVVNAGAPDVDVLYENRPAGRTNAQGQLLIPTLRSYQSNKISINPIDLPVDAEARRVQDVATPPDRSGVIVDFGVKTDVRAALVVLVDQAGKSIAPGSTGRLEGANEPFVVGYDGRAYVKALAAENTVVIDNGGRECRASFAYVPRPNSQVVIGPAVCQ